MKRNDSSPYGVCFARIGIRAPGLACCFTVLLFLGGASPLRAALSVYEGFDYTLGADIDGQNGGFGWNGAWSSSLSGTSEASISGGSIPALPTGLAPPTGGIGVINIVSAPGAVTIDRTIQTAINTNVVGVHWFSIHMLNSDTTDNTNGEALRFFRLFDGAGEGFFIGRTSDETPTVGLGGTLGFPATSIGGTGSFLVGKLVTNPSGIDDILSVSFYNFTETVPTGEPVTFELSVQNDTSLILTEFSVLQDRFNQGLRVDEIRIGDSYESVTSLHVPEPGVVATLASGLVFLTLRRRNRAEG